MYMHVYFIYFNIFVVPADLALKRRRKIRIKQVKIYHFLILILDLSKLMKKMIKNRSCKYISLKR